MDFFVPPAAAPDATILLVARLFGRWPGLHRRLLNIFQTFVRGLDGIRAPSHVAPLVAWTVAVWLVPALAAWTMFRALDLHLPFIAGWAVLSFVGLGISIPSAPGYVGVFHAAAVLAVGGGRLPAALPRGPDHPGDAGRLALLPPRASEPHRGDSCKSAALVVSPPPARSAPPIFTMPARVV